MVLAVEPAENVVGGQVHDEVGDEEEDKVEYSDGEKNREDGDKHNCNDADRLLLPTN